MLVAPSTVRSSVCHLSQLSQSQSQMSQSQLSQSHFHSHTTVTCHSHCVSCSVLDPVWMDSRHCFCVVRTYLHTCVSQSLRSAHIGAVIVTVLFKYKSQTGRFSTTTAQPAASFATNARLQRRSQLSSEKHFATRRVSCMFCLPEAYVS